MKSKMLWLVASIVVICMAITFAVISPQQTLLTQCSDQILDYCLCLHGHHSTRLLHPFRRILAEGSLPDSGAVCILSSTSAATVCFFYEAS
jgi:hypothetical protein